MASLRSLFNLVDRIVVVTIPSATARHSQVSELLNRFHLPFEFFWGRDCTESTVDLLVAEGQYDPVARNKHNRPPLTAAEIGCAISHRDLATAIASGTDEKVLILEDDVQIMEKNLTGFEIAVEACPSNWNMAYFGYQAMNLSTPLAVRVKLWTYYPLSNLLGNRRHNPETIRRLYRRPLNSHWMHAGWFNGAHAYAIDREAATYISRMQTPVSMEADLVLNHMVTFTRLNCICLKDPVIDQRWDIPSLIGARPSWKE
jgi:GR25 family glycosyltransferase involved in LPS biosynthesis